MFGKTPRLSWYCLMTMIPLREGQQRERNKSTTKPKLVCRCAFSGSQNPMKAVDYQMVGHDQFHHRSKKWWRRLFFFFLLAIRSYNAYIAARCAGGKTFLAKYKSGYKGWLEDLVKELVTPVTARRAPPFCLLFCLLID